MKIIINERQADITLETEKCLGDVLSGLEKWLMGNGLSISGVKVDGKIISSSALSDIFNINIEDINELSISTSTVAEICVEALITAKNMLTELSAEDNNSKEIIIQSWEQSPSGCFLRERELEIYNSIKKESAEEVAVKLKKIIEERNDEINSPVKEFLSLEEKVMETSERLENFALDIQIGKNKRAVETISEFSILSAKIMRLIPLLRLNGISLESLNLKDEFFEEFNSSLKEFFFAYEDADMVISGDLAEYEVAPRIMELYNAVKERAVNL
jgi:hypothetical protein